MTVSGTSPSYGQRLHIPEIAIMSQTLVPRAATVRLPVLHVRHDSESVLNCKFLRAPCLSALYLPEHLWPVGEREMDELQGRRRQRALLGESMIIECTQERKRGM